MFGLGIAEWVTIVALIATVPLTLMVMARASAAYERKAAERAAQGAEASRQENSPVKTAEGDKR